jgi:hypothetical protein
MLRRSSLRVLLLLAMAVFPARAQQPAPAPAPQTSPDSPAAEPAAEPSSRPVFDGDWWLSIGSWEQYGFVSGYQDCYNSEYHGPAPLTREVQSYTDDLNKYFLADPTRRKQLVGDALDTLRGAASDLAAAAANAAVPAPGDQPAAAGQSVYDGRFWFDADPAAELGFVEGYLACHTAKLKDADAKFSAAPSEYVDRLNQEYGITDDTDDIDADKAPIKLSDVLHKLRDEEAPPPKPSL